MFGGASPSLADIAAVTKNNDGNYGLGGNNGWWILIILFAIFGGWGNNGNWGNNGRGETTVINVPPTGYGFGGGGMGFGFSDAAMQRGFDNQTVITKLDGLNSGLCSLGYDQLAQMNGINSNIMQTGFGITNAINNSAVANMQNTNAISRQLADCCCDNRAAVKDLQYAMATQSCATNTNVHQTGDAIINNQNQGFQMLNNTIRDGFTNLEMQNQNRYIAELERKLNACDRDSALLAQSNYLINQLNPCARPAYLTCNPNTGRVFPQGCNDGCGSCRCN